MQAQWRPIFIVEENTIYGLTPYAYEVEDLVIPSMIDNEKIENISDRAFEGDKIIKNVVIENGIKTIGKHSFSDCISIEYVTFEESSTLSVINEGAFLNCKNLKKITIPKSVEKLGIKNLEYSSEEKYSGVFQNCISLKEVNFENGSILEETGYSSFLGCTSLLNIEFANSIKYISKYSFSGCTNLKNIKFSNQLLEIDWEAFSNCVSLTEIKIPKTVTDICGFGGCEKLQTITFEENSGLKVIGEDCFKDCINLSEIKIPKNVTFISYSAFIDCVRLENVIFEEGSQLKSMDYSVFCNCISLREIKIPKKVTYIGLGIFSGCINLEKVIFEENSLLETIGYYSFEGCISLKNIIVPVKLKEIRLDAFSGCDNLKIFSLSSETTSWQNSVEQPVYLYSENTPTSEGNYWHYVGEEIVIWEN